MTGSVLFTIVLTVLWFITGVRDLMGKDPLINLPFNQYNRDPEYRAFWQKKNGIWELANGITFGLSNVLIVFPEGPHSPHRGLGDYGDRGCHLRRCV